MKFDDVKKLHQKKYRTQFSHFLVEGEHLVLELSKALNAKSHIKNSAHHVKPLASSLLTQVSMEDVTLYLSGGYIDWDYADKFAWKLERISEKQMSQLSDTKSPQGIVARVPLPNLSATEGQKSTENCVYLHEIQDPGNLGTILRSMAWFGNFRLLLSKNSVDPFNSKVVRASMGAIFHVPIELDYDLSLLSSRFTSVAYLDMDGQSIESSSFKQHQCYLFGNEARGVPQSALKDMPAHPYTIKGCKAIDSLNLASAVSICAYKLSS